LPTVLITDHVFPAIDLQRRVIEGAGFTLEEIKPNCKAEHEVIQKCGRADVLLVQWAPITRRVLEALPNVKGVVRYGIGVDNIDVQGAKELGRMVSNVPNYCQEEVSDHAVSMILSLARRIPHDDNQIKHRGWGVGPFLPIPAFADLTFGLVGFGSIARKVSEKAKPFRFRQIASDPVVPPEVFAKHGVERVELDTLLRTADIISLHCPLLPQTRHMINAESIARMKLGAILVNTARGPLVSEADLVAALKAGKIVGAGLDVFEKEPLAVDSPLRSLPNVILTSHAASVSSRAVDLLQIQAAEAARDILLGKRPAGALV
jgi:D-3-phosphoglycerate dehydrogenase / 2-oxoglutarate reductase